MCQTKSEWINTSYLIVMSVIILSVYRQEMLLLICIYFNYSTDKKIQVCALGRIKTGSYTMSPTRLCWLRTIKIFDHPSRTTDLDHWPGRHRD